MIGIMSSIRIKSLNRTAVYHCMSRVAGKAHLLGVMEREVFRRQMWRVADFCGGEVLTYAVMSNHFHVLVRVPGEVRIDDGELLRRVGVLYGEEEARVVEAGLRGDEGDEIREGYVRRMGDVSAYMKTLKQRFSIWYNRRHGRVGTLWSERFKSVLVENGGVALRTVSAYIDLNAVRAGYCADPKDYRWCGYGEACGGGKGARAGLSAVMERESWAGGSREYRTVLYGKGYYRKPGAGGVSREGHRAAGETGGGLSLADALRCRVKYFGYGTVLGTREYVETEYRRHRERFGRNRRSGARALRGAEWAGLCALRDLRRDVFG